MKLKQGITIQLLSIIRRTIYIVRHYYPYIAVYTLMRHYP